MIPRPRFGMIHALTSMIAGPGFDPFANLPKPNPKRDPERIKTQADLDKLAAAQAKRERRAAKRAKSNGKKATGIVIDEVA